ncbi:MAG: hypothetical protein OXH92_08280 [Bryobacterales bacterium]|nr:hypothetical protein [Bryobacterales bacterium]
MKRSFATYGTSRPEVEGSGVNHGVAILKGVKYLFIVPVFFVAIFTSGALASERSAADDLLELEKYRYNESEDISRTGRYRSGEMRVKMLHLLWEILEEIKRDKTDELSELEKYRFNQSEDISKEGRYRSGEMRVKMLHMAWEIVKDLKENRVKRMTPCSGTTAPGRDGT